MTSILDLDATEVATKIRQGKYTSLEVTTAYITHLKKANKSINCITNDRFEIARQEAIEADLKQKKGEWIGRLHGVPISVKDCFHVAGMPTTSGLPHRKNSIEKENADIVERLKQEGAIIITKTNTPALCFCQETDNKLHGKTNNPWDLTRTAGGSSGGEGALISIGGAAIGVGADIGGSIRVPCHSNGVIGFKSGAGQISAIGNFPPVTIPEQLRMLGIGAMAKSVRDARLMDEILSDKKQQFSDLFSYKLVIPLKQDEVPLSATTEAIMNQLRTQLKGYFQVVEEIPPHYDSASLIWQQIMAINGAEHVLKLLSNEGEANPVTEYMKERLTGKSEIHSYLSWALIGAKLFKTSEQKLEEIKKMLATGDQELSTYFDKQILILPVYHETAQKHGKLYGELFSIRKTYLKYMPYISYANVWGLPALTIPIAHDESSMPIAIQLISKVGNEEAIFQLGEWLEKHIYRYRRCKKYD